MKLAEHNNKLQTNVQSETQNFGIGDASVVIDILRNRLYEHKIQTLVQEYICNARDAMREAGKGNQFDVTVPTHLNPVFKVRDYGPGISPDRMANVFVMYGASTKRNNNTQTGGFGIGAKSAWSYTDSFTIVSITDGIKRSYVAHTGVNNNGRLDLVSSEPTKEANGTEIQVAVNTHDITEFKNAVLRAVYFWEEKPKLLGYLNAPTLVHGIRVGNIEAIKANLIPEYASFGYENHPIALIDGVPYQLTDKLLGKCPSLVALRNAITEQLIVYIDNGVVEVSASRESIADSPKSIEALKKIGAVGLKDVKEHITNKFAKVQSTSEWIELYRELARVFVIASEFTKYKDYTLYVNSRYGANADIYVQSELFKSLKITEIHRLGRNNNVRVEKITKVEHVAETDPAKQGKTFMLPLSSFSQLYFFNKKESVIVQNKRIRANLFESNPSVNRMYVFEGLEGKESTLTKVMDDLTIKPFDTLSFVELPKEAKVKVTREKTQFCMHTLGGGSRFEYTTLSDNEQKWLYIPITKDGAWGVSGSVNLDTLKEINNYLSQSGQEFRICGLAERALNMVQGDVNFSSFADWLKDFKPSKEEINYVKFLGSRNLDKFEILRDCDGIKDKTLAAVLKEYKVFLKRNISSLPSILAHEVEKLKEVKEFAALDAEARKLLSTKYPLVGDTSKYGTHRSELTFYINAKLDAK